MEKLIEYFIPEKYELNLGIDKVTKKIGGVVVVTGEVLSQTIKFHAINCEFGQVFINGEEKKYDYDGEVLCIKNVALGKAEVLISYTGQLNENMEGAYLSTYEHEGETETIVTTQFESHYAREAFPCIDEPEAKAVFETKITVPDFGDLVLYNTPIVSQKTYYSVPDGKYRVFYDDDGKKTTGKYIEYTFEPTPRMSTYLLAFVIGKFHGKTVTNAHGIEITTYAALNQDIDSVDFANEIAAKSLEYYDDNFGVSYPLKKLTQVALPDFEAGAMENWGLVTYRESRMLVSKNATISTKKDVALTVTHELSHQWFGDLVTMKWWDDLWLNESFASVMEYYATDYICPEFRIFESFFTGDALAALKRDAYEDVQSVHQDVKSPAEISTLFDPAIVYAKGARLMLMLIRAMGWEKFCEGLKDYFEKFQYKNTVGDDLWEALSKYADFNVGKLMHAFIDRPGYPVISSIDGGFEKFKQKRFLIDGEMKDSDWPIPEISEDMSGHYILNLTEDEFAARLERFNELSLEEKLRLLIDRSLVTKTSLASSASLLPLIKKFENESSAAVWSIIATIIGGLKVFFEYGAEEQKKFAKFVGGLVSLKLSEIGLFTKDGDDENTLRLRAILLALDYYAETTAHLQELAAKYEGDYSKLDPEIRADILNAKLYLEPRLMNEFLDNYKKTADPDIKFDLLIAMALSKDKDNTELSISLLSQPEVVKPQDHLYLFIYLYRNPIARDAAFSWLTLNWDYILKTVGEKTVDNYARYIANAVRTEEEAARYHDFFAPKKDDPAMTRAVEIGEKEIKAQLELIKLDKEAVYQELDRLME